MPWQRGHVFEWYWRCSLQYGHSIECFQAIDNSINYYVLNVLLYPCKIDDSGCKIERVSSDPSIKGCEMPRTIPHFISKWKEGALIVVNVSLWISCSSSIFNIN